MFKLLIEDDYVIRNNADYLQWRDYLHSALLDYMLFYESQHITGT
jgi:hypothetical protein